MSSTCGSNYKISTSSKKGVKDKIKFLEDYYRDEMNKQGDFYRKKITELESTIESQSEGNDELEELNSTIESKDKEIEDLKMIIASLNKTKKKG